MQIFVKTLTGHDWTSASLYDVTLDTSAVGLERAVDVLADCVQRPEAPAMPPVQPRTAADRSVR